MTATLTVSPAVLALKPRQVLLSKLDMNQSTANGSADKAPILNPDQKAILLKSVACFLERNGFSKTLKKFRSEAEIEKDDLKGCLLDLEELYCKYAEMCRHAAARTNLSDQKEQAMRTDGVSRGDGEGDLVVASKAVSKKKTKKNESNSHELVNQVGFDNKSSGSKNSEEVIANHGCQELNVKSKENKKNKRKSDSCSQGAEQECRKELKLADSLLEEPDKYGKDSKKKKSKLVSKPLANTTEHLLVESLPTATEEKKKDVAPSEGKIVSDSGTEKKNKDERKKKSKSADDAHVSDYNKHGLEDKQGAVTATGKENSVQLNDNDTPIEEKSVKSKSKKKKKDDLASECLYSVNSMEPDAGCTDAADSQKDDKESKGSKKRKRLVSEENDPLPADRKAVEESKRRKIEGLKESKGSEQQGNVNDEDASKENKEEHTQVDQPNENIDKSVEKPCIPKSMKKQENGSVEPKTVKAFQRVKVDEVVFTDERLKDNSYWAKDGADTGYGAKAQDVLGQVRGRDFRHEKTKKKRGSYRGGQIDLHSHSVKFNYSDDE
ncbi:hypothetical protein FNV43_RR03132 [Rhamnella rubrinervis]|uniref:Srp40 C-terminal domain-containing protein n=1 Tax=Rhamnella rubrinervis TaxID=2594499 RepID=A0A8K0HJ94_9ROSA|nr:hypothetical protein FNV43_RR03132 [Rhamnella rubrinervis]